MHTWSKIRQKLEQEYLAESLRGRLTYFVTAYHGTHDSDEGRAAIRLDGAEILKSNYFDRMAAQWQHYYASDEAQRDGGAWRQSALDALRDGTFYQADFYRAFAEFDSQPIGKSLRSQNAVVRMFALLDRRTGKRTLERLRGRMQQEPQWLQMIYYIRLEAENLPLSGKEHAMKKGILFDLDGTLWDSSAQVTEAWNRTIREKTGRPEQFTVDDMHSYMGRTLEVIAGMMFPALPEAERIAILKQCSLDELVHLAAQDCPPLYPAEQTVLEQLAQDYVLGIVSNCQDGYIEIYLDKCGFGALFTDHECAGKTGLSKGENIRLVMERQGITDCVYLGDTQGDADAAAEAEIPFIHAAYGFGRVGACAASIREIRELPDAVRALIG